MTSLTASKLLILLAVIAAVVAFVAVAFGVENQDVYPACIALSLAFGWASAVVP